VLIQHKIQAGFIIALVFLLLTGVSAWWSQHENVETFVSFDHTHRVNDTLDEILVEMLNIETANRGFAISGNDAFLHPYQAGIIAVPKAFATAKRLMEENPRQQQRLAALEQLIQEKLNHAGEVIKLRRSSDAAAALQFISQGRGMQTMEEIRKVVVALKTEENQLLPGIKTRAKKLSNITMTIVAFGGVLSLGMIGLASFIVRRDFEKRQRAEAERELFFTVPLDMLCIIGADGYLKRVNPAFTHILGWSAEDLTTRPYLEFVHPDDRAAAEAEVARQLAQGTGVQQFEIRCLHKDGSSRFFWWKSTPHPDGLIFASARDVTEQKAAAEVLRSREEKLSVTLNSIGDAVLATDAQRRITRLNPIAEKLTGWTLAEALGRPVEEVFRIINEETREPAIIPVDDVLDTGEIHGLANHTVIISRDGTERPITDSAAPIRDPSGRIIGVVLVFRDVTKEHDIDRILRDGEALNRAVINSMMANIAVVNRHGTIIAINDGWERFARENGAADKMASLGVGTNYLDVCQKAAQESGADVQQVIEGLRGVLDHSRPTFKHEYACHSPSEERWFTMQVTPLSRKEGGAVIAQINITANKLAESEVRRLNENLEQLVTERTGALRESEERTRQIIDTALDAVITVDANGLISGWNPQARGIFGWDADEAIGRSLVNTIATPDQFKTHEQLWQQFSQSADRRMELTGTRRDGAKIRMELTSASFTIGGKPHYSAFVRDVTEMRKAEAEMLASRRRMSDILNSMFTFVGLFTPEGRMLEVNHSPLEATGVRRDRVIGQLLWEAGWWSYSAEAQEKVRSAIGRAASGEIVRDDFEAHTLGGNVIVVDAVFNPLRDDTGRIVQVVASGVDVTVRKRAEQALRESELRYRSLIETSGDAIFLLKSDGRILSANGAAAQMHGYTETEIIGMNMRDLDDAEAALAASGRLQKILQGETLRFELNHQRKDGSIFPLEVIATPVQIDGEWCILANERDITERRQSQERNAAYLRKLHRLSELSMQLSGEPGAVFDEVVGMVATLFEVPVVCLSEVLGQELEIKAVWVHGQIQHDAGVAPLSTSPCASVVASKDLRLYHCVQEHFPHSAFVRHYNGNAYCGVPSLDARGNVVAVTCLLDTRPHEFTEEDQQILLIIAQRVSMELERSRNFSERKNMESLALRSQRMEALGTLSGGVAHDLNNALAPILMGVELLKMRCPQESKILDMFETSARRGAEMVRQLLTFAKGAEGERVVLQVERLVHELESLMTSSFPKNIHLVVTCAPELPTVLGDATQMHQILLNLCVNARDAMPTGGTLTLEAQPMEVDEAFASSVPDARPGNYVALRVHDTGAGISKEIIERIFDPFFTTKSPDKGTGLGLSTVMGIVKSHGGFLQVSSQPGLGSTFTAFLPTHVVEGGMTPAPAAVVSCPGHGETILLVDDEPAVREMAGIVLQRLNFNPVTATDGADGLQLAMRHQAELRVIITDLHMPHMDGLAFVRVLRLLLPDIPVIVASGRMEDPQAAEMQALGVNHRLDKPFTEGQLAEVLQDILSPHSNA
jgi:PAS domain S-box-containing protein